MTKKILPTMIGIALAGGMTAAAADVSVFGHIDASVVNIDTGSNDDTNFRCTTCSIGFKGSEDLGNGLKAIFSIDFEYDIFNRRGNSLSATIPTFTTTTSGAIVTGTGVTKISVATDNSIVDRDQWVGLAGGFGQVRLGTISTSYKSHGAMLDPGYRTVAQMRDVGIQSKLHSGAGEEGQGRATNTVRWDSPDYNGVKLTAHYTLDSNEGDGEDDNPYGVGASYENGGLLVFADYITNDRGGDDDAWKIGGKFSMDQFAVFAQYESDGGLISTRTGYNSTDGADVWMLGGSATFGSNTVYAAYGNGDDGDGSVADEGYASWELVGVHGFSKNTLAYGGYVNVSPDASGADETDIFTVGMKHKF